MCYKEFVQNRNEEILENKFAQDKVPMFIQEFFCQLGSRAARINYWTAIKHLIVWFIDNDVIKHTCIADVRPEDFAVIRPATMTKYFEFLLKSISLSTFQTKRNMLSSFWTYLKQEHYVEDNVVRLVRSNEFKANKTNVKKMYKLPSEEKINYMIDRMNLKHDDFLRIRNVSIVTFLRGTGLRVSELVGLDLSDLHLSGGKLGDHYYDEPFVTVISKGHYHYGDDDKDIVFLSDSAKNALEIWLQYRVMCDYADEDAVFICKNGKRMVEVNVKKLFSQYSNGEITPHMLRHEYTVRAIDATKDWTLVQDQLRQKSLSTTINHYDVGAARSINLIQNM